MWYALGTIARWLVFAGLLSGIGALAFRALVLSRVPDEPSPEDGERPDSARSAAAVGALATRLLLLGVLGRLAAQLAFRDPNEPLGSELQTLLSSTVWGHAWLVQAGGAAAVWVGFVMARRPGRVLPLTGWAVVALSSVVVAFTPAFSGHAIAAGRWTEVAVIADGLHVMAGGVWLGTLAVMVGVAAAARQSGDPIRPSRLVDWITAFSPAALASSAAIGATGVLASWLHLDTISSLWASPYGRRLSLKLGFLLIVLACGAYNWKRSRSRLHAAGGLPPTVMLELVAGVLILVVTAVLVTTPIPGG